MVNNYSTTRTRVVIAKQQRTLASNPGFPFQILSRSFKQNPEWKAWVQGYCSWVLELASFVSCSWVYFSTDDGGQGKSHRVCARSGTFQVWFHWWPWISAFLQSCRGENGSQESLLVNQLWTELRHLVQRARKDGWLELHALTQTTHSYALLTWVRG